MRASYFSSHMRLEKSVGHTLWLGRTHSMPLRICCLCISSDDPSGLEAFWVKVKWLESLGASRADVGQPATTSWIVMADPAGNELCVICPLTPEELAAN